MQNVVFGDTGGHSRQLYTTLSELGVNVKDALIPKGLRIIHCGDLIHKGKDSSVLLRFVDRAIRNSPGQWIQLLGNHEFQHIEGAPHFWRCNCTLDDVGIINDLYDDELVFPAFGVDSVSHIEPHYKQMMPADQLGGLLFSHAGLTHSWWKRVGFISPPSLVAEEINREEIYSVTRAGEMLSRPSSPFAGPVWASAGELFDSWRSFELYDGEAMFSQVFGHTTPYMWSRNQWYGTASRAYREATRLNPLNRVSMTHVAGKMLFGIDPGYSVYADTARQPYLYFED